MQVKFFGGFQALIDGQPLASQLPDKSLALFGFLVQESGQAHRRERLAGLFWPETPETLARHSLSQALFSLNQAFRSAMDQSPFLITPHSIQIKTGSKITADTLDFDQTIELCEALERDQAPASEPYLYSLQQAVALYKGEFWAGFFLADCNAFGDWLEQTRVGYHQKIWRAANRLVEHLALVGRYEKALEYAYQLIEIDRLSEEGHRKVMHLLVLMNRYAEAKAHFQAYRQYLREELGTEPGDEISALHNHLLFQPIRIELPDAPVTNLPAAAAPIIGRQAELHQLVELLSNPTVRLVTVLGAGGAGKTRLALEAGWKLLPAFANGVFLAEANSHLAKEALLSTIAAGIGLDILLGPVTRTLPENSAEQSVLQEQLSGFLRGKEILLILDGLEQVRDVSGLLQHLLSVSPGLKILATSRVRMNLESETVFIVEGLPYPPAGEPDQDLCSYDAVELFIHSARRVNRNFALTPHNREAVAEICRMMEGMPLGILQASACELAFDTTTVLQELRANIDFLGESGLSLPDRQQNLRASFEYSWNLLEGPEQKAFLRLSIFRNTFHIERALHVCGISPHSIKVLIDHSFLLYRGAGLYRMHDLLREFAFERLKALPEELRALRQKFIQEYLESLVTWHKKIKSSEQFTVIDQMNFEHSNIRFAWDLATEHASIEDLAEALPGLCWFYQVSCRYEEGLTLCRQTEERIATSGRFPPDSLLLTDLKIWQAAFLIAQGKRQPAFQILHPLERTLQDASNAVPGSDQRLAFVFLLLAEIMGYRDAREGSRYAEKSAQLFRAMNDPWNLARCLSQKAACNDVLGNRETCIRLALEALEIQRQIGDPSLGAAIKIVMSYSSMLMGDYRTGLELVQELTQYFKNINSPYAQATSTAMLGTALFHAGLYEEAIPVIQEAYKVKQGLGLLADLGFLSLLSSATIVLTGEYEEGINKLHTVSETIPNYKPLCYGLIGMVFIARGDLAAAKDYLAQSAADFGQIARKDHAGFPLALLSLIAYQRGDFSKARSLLIEALEIAVNYPAYPVLHLSLSAAALLLINHGEMECAVELYALVTAHPTVKNSKPWADVYQKHFDTCFAGLPSDFYHAAMQRGRQQNLFETGQQFLARLQQNPNWL